MPIELLILISMLFTFAVGIFLLKLPAGVALAFGSIVGALVAGQGLPVRHLIEGSFGFLEPILIIATAMIFMKVIEATGALGTISHAMVTSLYRFPSLLMILVALFIMFPGMLTGLSSACILTTGAMVAPALVAMGMPRCAAGAFVAMSAVYGEIAPPINIPVMIVGAGVDMPYIGFEIPLLLASVPLAIVTAMYFRVRFIRTIQIEEVIAKLPAPVFRKHGIKLFFPIVVVVGLMAAIRLFPEWIPDIGVPLIFVIGTLSAFETGERIELIGLSRKAIRSATPILAILVGVGMFVQIMTLTGVRGFIAVSALQLPEAYLYLGVALILPAFGSAYTAVSVLGVPLVYAFLGQNEIVVTSAICLIASLGDLMPPPMLLTVFAGQLVGEKNYFRILRGNIIPIVLAIVVGIGMLIFADQVKALY